MCEVPGWGYQLTPDRVLTEMREVGLVATEFGPDGFLPDEPQAKAATLAGHGLACVGGFVPVVLHDAGRDPLPGIATALAAFVAAGADTLVLAADTGTTGYDERVELDDDAWRRCWPTWTGSRTCPASAASRRRCIRTSARSSSGADEVGPGAGRLRGSRCAWTPGT